MAIHTTCKAPAYCAAMMYIDKLPHAPRRRRYRFGDRWGSISRRAYTAERFGTVQAYPPSAACGSLALLLCEAHVWMANGTHHYQRRLAGTSLLARRPLLSLADASCTRICVFAAIAQIVLASCRKPATPPDAPCRLSAILADLAAVNQQLPIWPHAACQYGSEAVVASILLVLPESSASRQ